MSGETWLDVVRRHYPEATEKDAHFVLWNLTCYPAGRVDQVEAQLAEMASRVKPAEDGWRERLGAESDRVHEEMARLSSQAGDS